jgi:hypothetical protein
MKDERSTYVAIVRAEPNVDDDVRALRAWLKIGLRRFGLKCLGLTPRGKDAKMDMRGFAPKYIKPDQVRDGPIQTRIVNVFESERYGRPVLELENGSQFTLNDGNTNTLIQAWGHESENWIGQEIELTLGFYKNWKTDPPTDAETVKARAVSPTKAAGGNSGALSKPPLPASRVATPLKDDLADNVPF